MGLLQSFLIKKTFKNSQELVAFMNNAKNAQLPKSLIPQV